MQKVRTKDILDKFKLELISGEEGINRPITMTDISRPGLELAGFFDYYPAERVQLLGKTELTFIQKLDPDIRAERLERLCTDITPAIVVTRDMPVPDELIEASEREAVPVLRSKFKTTRFSSRLTNFLETRLAPTTAVHGVLIDIYGVGVLITGKSGVGKAKRRWNSLNEDIVLLQMTAWKFAKKMMIHWSEILQSLSNTCLRFVGWELSM